MTLIVSANPAKFVHSMTLVDKEKATSSPYEIKFFHTEQDMLKAFEELKNMGNITEILFADNNEYTSKYIEILKKALKTEARFTNEKNIPVKEINK